MATYSRFLLSGSTNGRAIPVAATATAGTLIHTAVVSTAAYDEVHLWVSNVTGSAATLTIEWGGVLDPGDHMTKALSVPANSAPTKIVFGQVLNNGLLVRAFSGKCVEYHRLCEPDSLMFKSTSIVIRVSGREVT
jgi:hypothetical protein